MTLTPLQIGFLQRIATRKPDRVRLPHAAAEFFAEHHYIGFRVGRSFEYMEEHHVKAALLLGNLKLPLSPRSPDTLRSEAVNTPGVSEKYRTRNPHRDSVAVKPIAGQCLYDGAPFSMPSESYAILTVEQAVAISAHRLLVVENLETFRLLERYRWIDYQGLAVLAIYRGDTRFRVDEAAAVVAQRSEPTWMFSDFDPAGLAMAAALPRLERVVLPDLTWLEDMTVQSRRQNLFADQLGQYGGILDRQINPLISPVWQLMKGLRAGLPQEWMAATPSPAAHY